jgi:hypothetical protein
MGISNFGVRVIRPEYLSGHFSKKVRSTCPVDIPGTVISLEPLSMEAADALGWGNWLPIFADAFRTRLYVRWDNDHKSTVDMVEVALLSLGTTPMYIPLFEDDLTESLECKFDRRRDSWYHPRTAPKRRLRPSPARRASAFDIAYRRDKQPAPTTRENEPQPYTGPSSRAYTREDYVAYQKSRGRAKRPATKVFPSISTEVINKIKTDLSSIEDKTLSELYGTFKSATMIGRVSSTKPSKVRVPTPAEVNGWVSKAGES